MKALLLVSLHLDLDRIEKDAALGNSPLFFGGRLHLLRPSFSLTGTQKNGVWPRNSTRRTSSCTNGPMHRSSRTTNLQVGWCVKYYLSSIPSYDWPLSSFGISKSRHQNWRAISPGNGLCLVEWLIRMVMCRFLRSYFEGVKRGYLTRDPSKVNDPHVCDPYINSAASA